MNEIGPRPEGNDKTVVDKAALVQALKEQGLSDVQAEQTAQAVFDSTQGTVQEKKYTKPVDPDDRPTEEMPGV